MCPIDLRTFGHTYERFTTGENARVIAGNINIVVITRAREVLELPSGGNVRDAIHNAARVPEEEEEGLARGHIKAFFMPSALELWELLFGSNVCDAIHNAARMPEAEEQDLTRVDSLDPAQNCTLPDIAQSWETNEQALEKLVQCLEQLVPSFQQDASLRQHFTKLKSRLRVGILQKPEETMLRVELSPQPTYSLCCGFPKDAIKALKDSTGKGHHHGLFWDVRKQLHALHGANDFPFKRRSITIQFLSVGKDVGCWDLLQDWSNQLGKEHPNMEQSLKEKKRTLTLDKICVLDKLQNSFCGVHVTFKVIHNKMQYSEIQGTEDKNQKTFSVLCFRLLDCREFEEARREWSTMRIHTMRKAPDAFLGISGEGGELRQSKTTARSSIQTVPREIGQLAASEFGQDEKTDEDVRHDSRSSDGDDDGATRLYVEIAKDNDSARATFFPTLIGCAVAYTCFAPTTQSKTTSG